MTVASPSRERAMLAIHRCSVRAAVAAAHRGPLEGACPRCVQEAIEEGVEHDRATQRRERNGYTITLRNQREAAREWNSELQAALDRLRENLRTLLYWHDCGSGSIDESWWDAARKLAGPRS